MPRDALVRGPAHAQRRLVRLALEPGGDGRARHGGSASRTSRSPTTSASTARCGPRSVADGPGGALQVIVGEEVRSRDGDLLGLFLERAVPPGLSAAETSAAIREQGGLVGLPHPFDGLRSSGGQKAGPRLAALAAVIDFVEVHNARAYRDANPRAAAFAREHGVPGVASSDAHTLTRDGRDDDDPAGAVPDRR